MRRLIILLCLLFSTLLHAQNYFQNYNSQPEITDSTGSLLIIVMDSDDSTPLIGANIKINKLQGFGVSNQYGSCVINNLKDGKNIVSCSYAGYVSSHDTVNIQAGRFNYFFVKLGAEWIGDKPQRSNGVYYTSPSLYVSFDLLINKEEFLRWTDNRDIRLNSLFGYIFKRGDPFTPIVMFTKTHFNQSEYSNISYSLRIIAPNDELFYFNPDLKPWYKREFHKQNRQDILVEIKTRENNLLGEYKILITIFDKNTDQTITMTSFFELVDPNTY